MSQSIAPLAQHPARALMPSLAVMEELGFDRQRCLQGTGMFPSQLEDASARISLQQELSFYRNVLALTADPLIGLKLGERYVTQCYGLFGYAVLSAQTFRHALDITRQFGRLTFSFFCLRYGVAGNTAWFSMSDPPPIEQALLNLYLDRDLAAARVDFSEILGEPFVIDKLQLPHDGNGRPDAYRELFDCEVEFGAPEACFHFSAELLDRPLPLGDPETSRHLQQQCRMMIARLTAHGSLVDEVRLLILSRPGHFPAIDDVAEQLGVSTRTLRRQLQKERSSYRALLDEIRFGLAKDYLVNSELTVEAIASLLGYSEAGNFSHAFRRWSGVSPTAWRSDAWLT